jgi:hypothetical protein
MPHATSCYVCKCLTVTGTAVGDAPVQHYSMRTLRRKLQCELLQLEEQSTKRLASLVDLSDSAKVSRSACDTLTAKLQGPAHSRDR